MPFPQAGHPAPPRLWLPRRWLRPAARSEQATASGGSGVHARLAVSAPAVAAPPLSLRAVGSRAAPLAIAPPRVWGRALGAPPARCGAAESRGVPTCSLPSARRLALGAARGEGNGGGDVVCHTITPSIAYAPAVLGQAIRRYQARASAAPWEISLPRRSRGAGWPRPRFGELRKLPRRALIRAADAGFLAALPLTRRRLRADRADGFAGERALLVAAAGRPEADVAWVGLFPHVPLQAASSLEIDEARGVLAITTKPGCARHCRARAPRGAAARVQHLAVGRVVSTGLLVHVAIAA